MSFSVRRIWDTLRRCFKTLHGFYKESPAIFYVVLVVILLLILIGFGMHLGFARFLGSRGAFLLDLAVGWVLLKVIVRMMVFPGSMTLVQRNTEATYRVEMARQYSSHLKQFHLYLRHVAKHSVGVPRGLTADGVLRGFAVVECLARSFRMQEHDKVRLNAEQVKMFNVAQHIERWALSAKIQKRTEGPPKPAGDTVGGAPLQGQNQETLLLVEWLRELTRGPRISYGSSPLAVLMSVELAEDGQDAVRHVGDVDQLISMLNDLRGQKSGWLETAARFIRVPTVGSLNQLRTELQMRYGSIQCWVPTRGRHQLDGMFIPCSASCESEADGEDDGEKVPLNSAATTVAFKGPTLVWCNPNAGYMEIMVYQSNFMKFYLERGCNIFLFNYSGYGRSPGRPTPSQVMEDGVSVIEFLRRKGISQIGVHGRSIGGIVACHLAQRYPDLVKFIVADRTFSTLGSTAQYLYGGWAAKGLQLSGTKADNMPAYLEARCYKVLICDPKDVMITDLASLRSGVALAVVSRMDPEERLHMDDSRLEKVSEAWRFVVALFMVTEEEDDSTMLEERPSGVSARVASSARQPTFSSPEKATAADVRLKVGDSIEAGKKNGGVSERISAQWIEDHGSFVRATFGPFTDQIRSAIDVVVEHLDAGGVCLHDVLGDNPEQPCFALQSWLANLQVWGSIGDQREAPDMHHGSGRSDARSQEGVTNQEIEHFLRKSDSSFNYMSELTERRLAELEQSLSPAAVAKYSRLMARSQVMHVRRELRRRLSALQQAFRQDAAQATEQAQQLRSALLEHLGEVDSFVTTISRFFKSVDLMLPYRNHASGTDTVSTEATPLSDSSDEKVDGLLGVSHREASGADRSDAEPRPVINFELSGHLIHTDCGHNGVLDESEFRLLGLHMRAARFGRVFSETH